MKKKITIIAGDPNSINSELIFKSWKSLNIETRKRIILIGNCNLIYKQQKKLKFNINVSKISNIYEDESIKYKVSLIGLKERTIPSFS